MPRRKKESVLDYLDSYALKIMRAIEGGEKDAEAFYSEVMKKTGLVRSNFNRRLNELLKLGLVKVSYVKDPNSNIRRPRALYSLTPTGKRILELLEEIERVYEEGEMERELGKEDS